MLVVCVPQCNHRGLAIRRQAGVKIENVQPQPPRLFPADGDRFVEEVLPAGYCRRQLGERAVRGAEPEQAGVTVEAVVAELVKQLDLSQLTETVGQVAEQMAAVTARMDKLEKVEAVKMENDLPRYVLQLTRASQAEETKLAEGDALKEQKPKETKADGSLAGQYFSPVK